MGEVCSLFVCLVADGWFWFVLREKYCWLVVCGWFVVREKYCWLVADKPNEQGAGWCLQLQDGEVGRMTTRLRADDDKVGRSKQQWARSGTRGHTWMMRMMKQLMKATSGRMIVGVVDGEVQKRER
jgi:hypothetical protein